MVTRIFIANCFNLLPLFTAEPQRTLSSCFICFPLRGRKTKGTALLRYPPNSFTILMMPSRIRGTLKLRINPRLSPDNLRYVKSCAL